MELVQLHGLLQCRGNSLFELFKLVKSLSYTQAQINLLVGRSLPFQASVKKMTKYLGYLNIIEDIEIRGFTLEKSTVFIQEFISGYYKTLENLHQNPHNNRVKEIILSQITAHVLEKADVYLQDLICKYKAKAPSRNSMILQAWTCLELSYNSAKYLFTTCCKWYLKSKKISLKYERTHCIVFALVINLLKNHQKLIWKKREQISGMFIKSQSFCRKYIEHKISKEKIFLLSCEFIILTVSNVKILKSGLKNVSFPVTFGKTSYAESYISYFFKQTYGILKRPTISIRLILQSKSYLLSYLKSNTEYITPALNSFQSCLQVSEERDLQKAFILVIHELFQIASAELRENIIIPYVLMCYHELSKHAAADLIHSILPLVPEHMLKSLDPIFTLTRSNPEQSQVAWVRKISKGLTSQQKAFEILDDLLIIYSSSYNSKEICNEIVKTLYVFTQNFSNAVIGKVVITVVELLVLHEKLLWIRNQTHDSEMIILAAFALLNVTKSCMEKNKKNLDFQVMNMFWCIVTHFQLQYPLEDLVSIRDLNENLQGLAKVTPNLFQLEQKDLNSVFLHLFQAPNYTKVFLPKLKTYLASICSKKNLDNQDYSILINSAAIYKLLLISPAETLLPRAFLYLSIESLASYEFFTEFITGLVEEYWKNIVKINASPVKDMMCLLKNCASVNKEVRAFAMKLLYYAPYSASAMFPSMFYSKEGLALCLDLFGALQLESTNEYSSSYPALYLPNSQEDLHLPCSRIAIKEILAFVEKYINDTLLKALCQDPRRVLSAYTFYVYHSNKLVKNAVNVKTFATTNFGISVLNQHYYSSKVVPLGNFHLLESYLFPEKFNLWFKQQRCEGSFLRDETILQMLGNYLSIADSLLVSKVKLQDMIERLKEYIMEDTAVVTHNTEIFDILGKTAGIMIITGETTCCSEVVQIPLNKSTIASITAAVYCWEWLIYSIPSIKSSICMELQLGWMGYISQVFLLQHQPFKKSLELIDYQVFQTENILTRLESMRMTINFIQKQIYTTTEDTNANKYLIRIIRDTLEQKMNPEVMNYEAGIEIFLQIIFITVDVIKFNLDETTADLSMKLLDFCISGFVAEHSWVKVSSMNKFNILKEKYEKCMEALKSLKVPNGSTTTVKEYYLNDPHTWQPRKQIEVFFASDQSKTTEGLYEYKKEILLIFIFHQYQRLIAWNSVFGSNCASSPKTGKKSKLVKKAWEISPNIGKIFGDIVKSHKTYEKSLSDSEEERKYLFTCPWKLPLIINALDSSNACERSYCLKLLHRSSERCKLYFMQQVLQCGHPTCKYEDYKRHIGEEDVWSFLTTNAMHSSVFLSQLIWMLEVSLYNPDADLSSTLGHNFHRIILKIISDDPEEWEKFNREQSYFNNFLQISADLIPKNPENFNIINEKLSELSSDIPQGIYIPTNPQRFVVGLRDDNGRPLQSAKRTPILITFYTKAHESDHAKSTQCIFKVNDDVRNDQLCLQIIELMREILSQTGLKIYLRPYKVISNITHTSQGAQLSGIIECIPNCKSRDEIGKEGTDSLYTYFLDKFGTENSDGYVEAKKNFIASLAGYAVASYLLQIKDRHNGNILIDEHGHIVHIDFGFILSISPGGNMRFERPGFKLTQEMIDIIGTNDSESFEFFKTLVAKGYLAVREQAHSFIALISRMEHSGLTCFRKNAVANFIKRFYLGSSLPDAIKKINEKISKANNSFFTLWYDRIQLMQQQIEY